MPVRPGGPAEPALRAPCGGAVNHDEYSDGVQRLLHPILRLRSVPQDKVRNIVRDLRADVPFHPVILPGLEDIVVYALHEHVVQVLIQAVFRVGPTSETSRVSHECPLRQCAFS